MDIDSLNLPSWAPLAVGLTAGALLLLAMLRALGGRRSKAVGSYVYVEDDGTVRELEPFESAYLSTEFPGGDGGRPYVKQTYRALTPDGRIGGFLRRADVPPGRRVKSALEGTTPLQTAEQAVAVARIAIAAYAPHASVDVTALGSFSASLEQGVWRVSRVPEPSEAPTPPPVVGPLPQVVSLSAASGRIVTYGWS